MPHPRRPLTAKIPRFSSIVKSEAPALESPHAHENSSSRAAEQKFNPRVAAYTLGFVGVLIGGLYIGATSKDIMANWEVKVSQFTCSLQKRKQYESLSTDGKLEEYVPRFSTLT